MTPKLSTRSRGASWLWHDLVTASRAMMRGKPRSKFWTKRRKDTRLVGKGRFSFVCDSPTSKCFDWAVDCFCVWVSMSSTVTIFALSDQRKFSHPEGTVTIDIAGVLNRFWLKVSARGKIAFESPFCKGPSTMAHYIPHRTRFHTALCLGAWTSTALAPVIPHRGGRSRLVLATCHM